MTTVVVRRPPAQHWTGEHEAGLILASPPQLQDQQSGSTNVAMIVMPLVSGSGSLLITLTNQSRPLFAAAGLVFMVVSVGLGIVLFVGTRSSARRRQRHDRERYLDYVERIRHDARSSAARQHDRATHRHPYPDRLLDFVGLAARRWERRTTDSDFLHLRVGQGCVPLERGLSMQVDRTNPLISYDQVCLSAAENVVARYARLGDEPIVVPLTDIGCLSIVGDRSRSRALARALIASLAATHPPDEVGVAVVRAPALESEWEWVKWLPHNAVRVGVESGPELLVVNTCADLIDSMRPEIEARTQPPSRAMPVRTRAPRRWVVVLDGEFQLTPANFAFGPAESSAELGIHLVTLVAGRNEEPEQVDVRITVGRTSALLSDHRANRCDVDIRHVDELDLASATAVARSLAPCRLASDGADDADDSAAASPITIGLRNLLGVDDVATIDPHWTWQPRSADHFLRVPLGVGDTGGLIHLDLKESARGGMGPHGLLVGATGSGKSEMLRTMVTSLAIAHPPDRLALLLVDFKGGATFGGFEPLPHLAGMVTNLAEDPGLVQRFRDTLYGELTRRQRLLAAAGNLPDLAAYAARRHRADDPPEFEPLPHLLVIVDEFTELLTARPDFAELFLAVGRIGRSIGVHLLLSTQRLDAGKIRGLDSHLSYRIGLRTFSEAESREALGVPDAYHLPAAPGSGFLKVDTSVFKRFTSALVSMPYRSATTHSCSARSRHRHIRGFTTASSTAAIAQQPAPREANALAPDRSGRGDERRQTVLDVAVQRLASTDVEPVRRVWLEPLPNALALDSVPSSDELLLTRSPVSDSQQAAELTAVLGLRDLPGEQQQLPLTWDFAGPQGNLLVLGGALSGKSVLLRTVVCSLALRHAPGQIACYCIDYGGATLAALEHLPHVATVATRSAPDLVRRAVTDVLGMLDTREQLIGQRGWDGANGLRRARRDGTILGGDGTFDTHGAVDVPGDVFLVIDGWAALRETESEIEDQVLTIAHRGPSLGVHLILSAGSTSQVRARLAAALPGRIELRLADPFDSSIDRRLAESIPERIPGRALVPGGYLAQIALPRIDGQDSVDDLRHGVMALVEVVRRRWPGTRVSPVRVLPAKVELAALGPATISRTGRRAVAVGLSERDLAPALVDLFGADPHLQVYGEAQSGKSALLRSIVTQLMRTFAPKELGIVLVDYRRAHLDLVPPDHLLGYCTGAGTARQLVTELGLLLSQRLPGPQLTSRELRARSWWTGRDIVVIVDDYDLVAGASGNPLAGLAEFVPHGRDVGLHVVTARRTGGASRAMYETLTQTLTDAGGPGFLLSGDRAEGRLVAGVASLRLLPGRALLARRGHSPEQVQIAWTDPV